MRFPVTILAAVGTLSATTAQAHRCAFSNNDRRAVETSVRAFYDALARDDRAGFERSVTRDFFSYDAGERMSADQLFTLVEGAHRSGRVIRWTLGPMTLRGNCDSALAAWENNGSAGVPPRMAPRRWLESATLRREGTAWRIDFMHSSPVPPVAPRVRVIPATRQP